MIEGDNDRGPLGQSSEVTRMDHFDGVRKLRCEPRVEILSPTDGEALQTPFRVQMHASGYNLSHVAAGAPDTGHFRLTLERARQRPKVIELDGGQTEVWLTPP